MNKVKLIKGLVVEEVYGGNYIEMVEHRPFDCSVVQVDRDYALYPVAASFEHRIMPVFRYFRGHGSEVDCVCISPEVEEILGIPVQLILDRHDSMESQIRKLKNENRILEDDIKVKIENVKREKLRSDITISICLISLFFAFLLTSI